MLQAARQPFVAVHVVGSCLLLLGGSSCAWRLGFWSLVSGAVPGGRLAYGLGGMFESTLSSPPLSDPEDELLLSSKSIGIAQVLAAAAARLLPRRGIACRNRKNLCFNCPACCSSRNKGTPELKLQADRDCGCEGKQATHRGVNAVLANPFRHHRFCAGFPIVREPAGASFGFR